MVTFIKNVLLDLKEKNTNIKDLCFILPNKRAGVFLKHELSSLLDKPVFSPEILSIEEFVEQLSGLQKPTNSELLFKLYKSYTEINKETNLEVFDSFVNWAQILLQDFNEIDRYLIPQKNIFDYLSAVRELHQWTLDSEPTDLIKNHLKFWKRLKTHYSNFTEALLESKHGYQGLIYREAVNNLESYIELKANKKLIFLGFNALNTSEIHIIQELLQNDLAEIYWDIDQRFLEDNIHDAGLFIREHKQWNFFNTNPFKWVTNHYTKNKTINVVGVPKLVGQAKYVGQLLKEIKKENSNLSNVAVVLGEESLLLPVLNSIPAEIEALNVTMGLPLNLIPIAAFFENLFELHKKSTDKFYYKEVINLLSYPSIYSLFQNEKHNIAETIISTIQKNNTVYLSVENIKQYTNSHHEIIELLFNNWKNNSDIALKHCSEIIFKIKNALSTDKSKNSLELEFLYRFHELFNKLSELNLKYTYLKSISVLHSVYKELLSSETLDFKGEPLEGLQIMGVLESRVLDFETVIITSVNEGILPSGKTDNSFIPYDVKIENNLPTFKEKDAVYTYHFYRLLQRAKNVHILYNTEIDTLKGGEKSRFITQLEVEGVHHISHSIVASEIPVIKKELKEITKTNAVIEKLKLVANKGFSPSSLSNYIRNPIDFYYEKILGVKEFEDVEENIAANTLGSVIHNTLEEFYKPYEEHELTEEILHTFKTQIKEIVTKHFKKLYGQGDFSKGKNLIIFEIAQRYISNFIDMEIADIKAGNTIKILKIETEETLELSIDNLDFPIKLTGKVDRVDNRNGVTRIIDYKSGKVDQNKVEIVNWEDLTQDYEKYSKSFQVLCYAYMMHKRSNIKLPVEAGIISFKNLNNGFLKFGKKETSRSRTKNQSIDSETLINFEKELKNLIIEICNPNLNFIEKELD